MRDRPTFDPDQIAAGLQKLIGSNVRELRESRSLTQEQLAYTSGTAARHLQKIEAGQINITLRTIARLCWALGVEPQAILAQRSGGRSR